MNRQRFLILISSAISFLIILLAVTNIDSIKSLFSRASEPARPISTQSVTPQSVLYTADFSQFWPTSGDTFSGDFVPVPKNPVKIYSEIDPTGLVGSIVASIEINGWGGGFKIPHALPTTGSYLIEFNSSVVLAPISSYDTVLITNIQPSDPESNYTFTISPYNQMWFIRKNVSGAYTSLASGTSAFINIGAGTINRFKVERNLSTGYLAFYLNNQKMTELANEKTFIGGTSELVFIPDYQTATGKIQFGNFVVTGL